MLTKILTPDYIVDDSVISFGNSNTYFLRMVRTDYPNTLPLTVMPCLMKAVVHA